VLKTWRHSAPAERWRILLNAAEAPEAPEARVLAFIETMAAEVGASVL
jgi:hypothetical protein